jgi:succinate dehydrogenase hydrophobic anchor subunit
MKKTNIVSYAKTGHDNFHHLALTFGAIALITGLVFLFGLVVQLDQGSPSEGFSSFADDFQHFALLMAFAGLMMLAVHGLQRAVPLSDEEVSECLSHPWDKDAQLFLLSAFQKNKTIRMHHVFHALYLQRKLTKQIKKRIEDANLQLLKESNSARLKHWEQELSANSLLKS